MFSSVQIEGNLIASDFAISNEIPDLKGQTALDFGLKKSDKLEDEIAYIWGETKDQWSIFQRRLARLDEDDPATSLTREYWAIPLLKLLGYDPTYQSKAEIIDGQTYAISHRAGRVRESEEVAQTPPIHIIGCRVKLEQKPPSGSPRLSAHALVQEYLNRTEHLWAIATNGLRWRLLRDSSLMTRLTYVEFDLEQILNGEDFAAFGAFYRLFHRTRLPAGMEDCDACLLEFYHQEAIQQGGRVRDELYKGMEIALETLGTGFLQHPRSENLRAAIASGELSDRAYFAQLLQLIYRLLFLMVAESRDLLLMTADAEKMRLYREYYSIERLRMLAERPSFSREGFEDLWQGLIVTFRLFAGDEDNWRGELLGLSPLNGQLFGLHTLDVLHAAAIDNYDLLLAIRSLSLFEQNKRLQRVNYAALNAEELGSIYEKVLDTVPRLNHLDGFWTFQLIAGSDRKTTGSYYTPPELVAQLIKSALEPVIAERLHPSPSGRGAGGEGSLEQALLSLKICDPACGSGHFLLAASRCLGKELARVRTGEMQPGPEPLRLAIRDVIQHCIYGVDLNPLAVDLCKVALWIEGFCQGMPLSFLDHRIKCGNSLVGVFDLEVLKEGIPDGAYKPVTGDDKKLASARKKDNKSERQGQRSLFDQADFETDRAQFAEAWQALGAIPEETLAQIRQKQSQYEAGRQDARWWNDRVACNLWTAAFFTPITAQGLALVPTTAALARLLAESKRGRRVTVSEMVAAANQLADELRVFHWPLEFPEVFEQGGFDCVLGNPPWERIKLQEKEFFAARDYEIATAQNKAAREKLIKTLPERKPELALAWQQAKHEAENQGVFIREAGRFPLTSRGDINTYAVFSELARDLIAGNGRAGIIIPPGIASDDTTKNFFNDLMINCQIVQLTAFVNEKFIFKDVLHNFRFCYLSLTGVKNPVSCSKFCFECQTLKEATDSTRYFNLTTEDLSLLNPNTLTCPVFRNEADAKITRKIYQTTPVLENEKTSKNPWSISFMRMLDMSNDSGLFQNEPGEGLLPLYEGKMFNIFDHRFGSYESLLNERLHMLPETSQDKYQDTLYHVKPFYYIFSSEVDARLNNKWNKSWLIAFRGVTSKSLERSAIFSILPKVGLSNSCPLIISNVDKTLKLTCLVANFCCLVFDFVVRQKIGGANFNFFIVKQLPVLPPDRYTQADINYITPRVLELTYTAWDIKPFAEDLWNPAPTPPLERETERETQTSILSQTSNQQLSLGLDISPPQQQLEIPTPKNPPDLIKLRQLIRDQWQANHHATPIPNRIPLEQISLDPTTEKLPIPPFIWNEDRRAKIRAELDAYYAKLYGLTRDELRYILDPTDVYGPDFPSETFRVLKNNEIKKYGEYRTQRLVLAAWDMLEG